MNQVVGLNWDGIKKEFKVKENSDKSYKLNHSAGSSSSAMRVLPYTASNANLITDYNTVIGNYSRGVTDKKYDKFEKSLFFETVKEKVNTDSLEKLYAIINELFFEGDQLILSHPLLFNYLPEGTKNEQKVGNFLAVLFSNGTIKNKLKQAYNKKPTNTLLSLIFTALNKLEEQSEEKNNYEMLMPEILQLFEEDLLFLLENESLFVKHYKRLLIYYYFFYVTQIILNLDQMFKQDEHSIIPVYFNVDWESRSKTRDSFKQGWKMVSTKLPRLFAHINCVMMLNHIETPSSSPLTYVSFKQMVKELNDDNKQILYKDLQKWHKEYRSYIGDVNWTNAPRTLAEEGEDLILMEVRSLQSSISYQFQPKVSSRARNAEWYYENYENLAKKYFLKQKGNLGYTFNLNQELIIFFTKLCIKKRSKISLKELFCEFQKRGIYFDRDTQKQVVNLYERLNILEKKSDSGDAQYVKYIL